MKKPKMLGTAAEPELQKSTVTAESLSSPEPDSQPESENSYSDPDGAHVLEIDVLDEFGPEIDRKPVDDGLMSKDEFWLTFRGVFAMPNMFIHPPLKSLDISPGDAEARLVSDKLYGICGQVRWMNWLLSRESENTQAAIIIAMWLAGTGMAVRKELAERAASRRRAKAGPALAEAAVTEQPVKPSKTLPEAELRAA